MNITKPRSRLPLALVLLVLLSVGVYFWFDAALRYFLHFDESLFRRYWPNRGWLTAHIAGGTLALLLGPFQFWTGLKLRQPKLHRLLGYTYSLGILLGSATSFVLAFRASIPDFRFSLFFLGLAVTMQLKRCHRLGTD